jgi:hypothetical protein
MIAPPKTEMLGIHPANYHEARDLFRQAAQDLGAHLENHVVLSGAEYGGDLTIDVAVVGFLPGEHRELSGLHPTGLGRVTERLFEMSLFPAAHARCAAMPQRRSREGQ